MLLKDTVLIYNQVYIMFYREIALHEAFFWTPNSAPVCNTAQKGISLCKAERTLGLTEHH